MQLKTIAVVNSRAEGYDVRYDGVEIVDANACYRLILTPRREPERYRLRELWIDRSSFVTRRALIQGNFTQGPSDRIAWIIEFGTRDRGTYITQETALAPVRYSGQTYTNVAITFQNVRPAPVMDAAWSLSTFQTLGDILKEPAT